MTFAKMSLAPLVARGDDCPTPSPGQPLPVPVCLTPSIPRGDQDAPAPRSPWSWTLAWGALQGLGSADPPLLGSQEYTFRPQHPHGPLPPAALVFSSTRPWQPQAQRAGSQGLQRQLLVALQSAGEGPPASMSAWASEERQGPECPADPPGPSLRPLWSRRHPKGFDEKPPLGPQGSRPLPERRRMTAQPPLSTGGDRGRLRHLWGVLWNPCYTGWNTGPTKHL